jgi:hypothetical protein
LLGIKIYSDCSTAAETLQSKGIVPERFEASIQLKGQTVLHVNGKNKNSIYIQGILTKTVSVTTIYPFRMNVETQMLHEINHWLLTEHVDAGFFEDEHVFNSLLKYPLQDWKPLGDLRQLTTILDPA